MNYFALFLNDQSYIEKCLILIKYISSPKSKSLPHITLRLFKEHDEKLEYIKNKRISYLNIIEPGTFNLDTPDGPYVVFLRCESEELEEIDYRPDFPFSRLHITLYEGNDFEYAKELFIRLQRLSWHFKLVFDSPKHLSERKMGTGTLHKLNYDSIFDDVFLTEKIPDFCGGNNAIQKLEIVDLILDKLSYYLSCRNRNAERVESLYLDQHSIDVTDVSNDQLGVGIDSLTVVNKPVQDAIFVTPPEYARDMAICALDAFGDSFEEIHFGDSAIGTGALFIAIKRLIDSVNQGKDQKLSFASAIGIDIDERMAREAFLRCSQRNLKVIHGDAISPGIDLGKKRNMMMVNPPYNRHENIPEEYRKQAKELAERQTGITISANAGLYVYHLLIMDKWLVDDGVAVWLIPSIFLQAKYGKAVRQYLTNNVQLLRMHVYDEQKLQFDRAMVSTTIVVFKKTRANGSQKVFVSYGASIDEPQFSQTVMLSDLCKEIDNWRSLVLNSSFDQSQQDKQFVEIKFSSLFDVKRGLATGANSFFVLERNDALKLGIPEIALKPILPKARYIKSLIIDANSDGYPNVNPQMVLIDCDLDEDVIRVEYPRFYAYLQKAKEKDEHGKAIVDRTLIRSRKPWYKQEQRTAPLFLLTYMGRNKRDLPPLYFLLNKSKAVALNTFLLLYPKPWLLELIQNDNSLCEQLLSALNKSAEDVIAQKTRVYSGGLQKLEPNELKNLFIKELPRKVIEEYERKQNDFSE